MIPCTIFREDHEVFRDARRGFLQRKATARLATRKKQDRVEAVCRVGGAKCVFVTMDESRDEEFEGMNAHIVAEVIRPLSVEGTNKVCILASIGAPNSAEAATDKGHLLRNGDHARFNAKSFGRNRWGHFSDVPGEKHSV